MTSLTEGLTGGTQGSVSVECLAGIRYELRSADEICEFGLVDLTPAEVHRLLAVETPT